jgi:hypothetical protein
MNMAKIWPFGKKPAEPRQVKQPKKRKIVEYERKPNDSSGEKVADRSHLEDAAFKDAMALLGDDSKK